MIAAGSALLVIDLQTLTLPNAVTRSADELLPDVARLIAEFRTRDLPVLHAVSTGMPVGRTSYGEGGRTWPLELRAIADAVQPAPHEPVVERAAWSAFAGTEMLELLTERGVTTVVIVGLATPFGIESTARSAYDLGFSVVVPSDAVAGPDASAHEWTLTRVIPLLGTTTTVGELLAE